MHFTPVTIEITFLNKKEDRTIRSPIIPYLKLFLAPSSFLASPAELINLNPLRINITRATNPENKRRALRRFEKTAGIQLRVATSPGAQLPHALNIDKEYQREGKKTRQEDFLVVAFGNYWNFEVVKVYSKSCKNYG